MNTKGTQKVPFVAFSSWETTILGLRNTELTKSRTAMILPENLLEAE